MKILLKSIFLKISTLDLENMSACYMPPYVGYDVAHAIYGAIETHVIVNAPI